MSPVSRSRKPKKNRQSGTKRSGNPASARNIPAAAPHERLDLSSGNLFAHRSGLSAFQQLVHGRFTTPDWFEPSFAMVLDEAEALLDAQGPRQLEDMTASLLGARIDEAMREEHDTAFGEWIAGLIDAAEQWAQERLAAGEPGGQAALFLLYGLSSVGSPAIANLVLEAVSRLRPLVSGAASGVDLPEWLKAAANLRMTGDIWTLRDVYGSRIGVIAATAYPGGLDPAVYLFDIDACGFVVLAGGGTYDDVRQAAAAWRAGVGAAAAGSEPQPLAGTGMEALRCLTEVDLSEITIRGTETRAVWDEWFRAQRRIHDVSDALRRQGSSLPATINLYHDVDIAPTLDAFTAWLWQEQGQEIDDEINEEAVEALVGEWLEGALPDTADSVSPHRIDHQLALINDWIPDHPSTIGAKRLLPDWVRFLAQRSGISETATATALATLAEVSEGGHRADEHCRDVH